MDVEALRQSAEDALESGGEAVPLLKAIVKVAPKGSDDAIFAHRHLAELLIEEKPWNAALHLRALLEQGVNDDIIHGLMGLCHALLGNFAAAVASYRRALRGAPRNPWYHHNIGHLLDVALADPDDAIVHLRIAHGLEPDENEIAASLCHCLARIGLEDEAYDTFVSVFGVQPEDPDHEALLDWIKSSPKDKGAFPMSQRARMAQRAANTAEHDAAENDATENQEGNRNGAAQSSRFVSVAEVLAAKMNEADRPRDQIKLAQSLWSDFSDVCSPRIVKPEVFAAAIEYAARVVEGESVTRKSVASRYRVSPNSLSCRFTEIRDALNLDPAQFGSGAGQRPEPPQPTL